MPVSDLTRELYEEKPLCFQLGIPDGTTNVPLLTNVPTSDTAVLSFPVPFNCELESVNFGIQLSSAASSTLTVKVKRGGAGGTTLASATSAAQTAAQAVCGDKVAVTLSKCELLTITVSANAATDDFTGVTVIILVEPLKTDS